MAKKVHIQNLSVFEDGNVLKQALIKDFANIHIEMREAIPALQELRQLFMNLKLVADGKPPLVTFSKTLHFYLPDLVAGPEHLPCYAAAGHPASGKQALSGVSAR